MNIETKVKWWFAGWIMIWVSVFSAFIYLFVYCLMYLDKVGLKTIALRIWNGAN